MVIWSFNSFSDFHFLHSLLHIVTRVQTTSCIPFLVMSNNLFRSCCLFIFYSLFTTSCLLEEQNQQLLFYTFGSFSHQCQLMVFHWSLSVSNFRQVSRILLSFLADLSSVVGWMVFTRPLISKSFSPFNNPFMTLPRAPIAIDINVIFIFHSFFFLSIP